MKNLKTKKIDKAVAVGFAANFCAVFSLIYVVGLLLVANIFGGPQAGLAAVSIPVQESCSCKGADETCAISSLPAVLFPVSADNPNEAAIKLSMDDTGYLQKELNISLSSSRRVQISNNGVTPHSFVIDELGIDSGDIAPGQSKILGLENLADGTSYVYYSKTGSDAREKFSGTVAAE